MGWFREAPLTCSGTRRRETWRKRDPAGAEVSHPVEVFLGKKLQLRRLRSFDLGETQGYAAKLSRVAADIFAPDKVDLVSDCPGCEEPTAGAETIVCLYGANYVRCRHCGHVFVAVKPRAGVRVAYFADSEDLAGVYTDRQAAEARLEEIALPKLDWCLDRFRDCYDVAPRQIIDVGAGGGHFLEAARRRSIRCEGYEISRAARLFAQKVFDLNLKAGDFVSEASTLSVDLITFWGVLEYADEPSQLLAAAQRALTPGAGMIVLEVPRVDCLGTGVLQAFSMKATRHLEPTSHQHCFSDSSIASLLDRTGFVPVAAWYFGLDIYELFCQQALALGRSELVDNFLPAVEACQEKLDVGCLCDDLVIAAVPGHT